MAEQPRIGCSQGIGVALCVCFAYSARIERRADRRDSRAIGHPSADIGQFRHLTTPKHLTSVPLADSNLRMSSLSLDIRTSTVSPGPPNRFAIRTTRPHAGRVLRNTHPIPLWQRLRRAVVRCQADSDDNHDTKCNESKSRKPCSSVNAHNKALWPSDPVAHMCRYVRPDRRSSRVGQGSMR